ncbi:MAG: hypothetical protein ACFE9L_04355 [Candidatus Hodarchaeota archaeon]
MKEDELLYDDTIIFLPDSKLWTLKVLIELFDHFDSFMKILSRQNISEEDINATDFRTGFGEGVQILISLHIQDLLRYPKFYGFSKVPKQAINLFFQNHGLDKIPPISPSTVFLQNLNEKIKDLDFNRSESLFNILNCVKNLLLPIGIEHKKHIHYSHNHIENSSICNKTEINIINKTIFWDFFTQEYAAGHIWKLWGEIDEVKLTAEQKRGARFYRGIPKLTKHPNAWKLSFKGYLACILLILEIITNESAVSFFNNDHKFYPVTKLESWEPMGKSENDVFNMRLVLSEVLSKDLTEDQMNCYYKLKEDFSLPIPFSVSTSPMLELDYIFGGIPVVSPKELSHSIFGQSFLRIFFKGLIEDLGEENVEINVFLHPIDNDCKKLLKEVKIWEKPLPGYSSFMEGKLTYFISLAILIPSQGTIFGYSRWLIFHNIGTNEIMESTSENQAYFLVKHLIEEFNIDVKIYLCSNKYFKQFIKSLEEKTIDKAQEDLISSRNNLRGLLAEFITGYILSSYGPVPLKVHQRIDNIVGDFDLIGLKEDDNKIILIIIEVKDISKSKVVYIDTIQRFLDKFRIINLSKICKKVFNFKTVLPIKCDAYFVTTRFFSRDIYEFNSVKGKSISEEEVSSYIKTHIQQLPKNITVNHLSSKQIDELISKEEISSAFRELQNYWKKIEWFEQDLALYRE